MVDADRGLPGDGGLGMERDPEAGELQHRQVVRPVADGDHVVGADADALRDVLQRGDLGLLAHHGWHDVAGQRAVGRIERVGAVLVETEGARDRAGEVGEPPGDERGIPAVLTHCGDQRPPAGRQADPLGEHGLDHLRRQSAQETHPLPQRLLEVELAVHGPSRDVGHALAHPRVRRQLVDALLLDHGGVHVGEQHPPPTHGVLLHEVDATLLPRAPQLLVQGSGRGHLDRDRGAGAQPAHHPVPPVGHLLDLRVGEVRGARRGQQGEDRHAQMVCRTAAPRRTLPDARRWARVTRRSTGVATWRLAAPSGRLDPCVPASAPTSPCPCHRGSCAGGARPRTTPRRHVLDSAGRAPKRRG